MKNIFKSFIFLLTILLFTSCSSSFYNSSKKEELRFNVNHKLFKIPLDDAKFQNRISRCVYNAYTLDENNEYYGKLFLEYISLKPSCTWNGLEKSYFTSLFKRNRAVKSMKTLENFEISNYNFSTYKINDKYYMNIIFIFSHNKTTLIIDYEGKLTRDLLLNLNYDYKNTYLNKQRFSSNYKDSLVLKNMFNRYFYKEYVYKRNR